MKLISRKKKLFTHLMNYCFAMILFSGPVFAEIGIQEEHSEEVHIKLTEQQIEYSDIQMLSATSGTIRDVLPVYGVVIPNAERIQSIKARFSGIIRNVNKSVGDQVEKGETLLTVEANDSLKTYTIKSSLNGVVTQRNANVGEHTTDSSLLVVQDFSSVWVELSIFPRDVSLIELGQNVRIISLDSKHFSDGKIIYIAPQGGSANQTVTARALVENPKGEWKPGLFVNAQITQAEITAPVVVRNEAIQIIEGNPVVFVQGEKGFEPRLVTLGRTDGDLSEILNGLSSKEIYVSRNSFVLKSELGKEDAEHGH
ncbi:efflux RND transporter periplasmic adaptor subunit [Neptunicella sp.]|uniref:efflux RND transporter periplasmic adaptor subunit n=1 Tax=Neptunicella sp. TaxID=2125986 RepID=UPI003F6930D8